jgi:uncharacterized protein
MRFFLAVAALIGCVLALPAIAAEFKIPPTPDHRVTDPTGVLSSATRTSIENELQAYEAATGHQIIVWIGQSTGGVPLETWTGETADHWKIGRRGRDDGAVLFLLMQDRKARIEVGYGLESALTDADSYRIIENDIAPRMRAGDVDGAVSSGVAAMLTTISPSYQGVTPPPQAAPAGTSDDTVWIVVAIFLLFLVLPIVVRIIAMALFGHVVMRGARGGFFGGAFSSFGGGGGFGGGGFSAGGGGFGGGGASGGW